jgi:hypothetical protein
MFSAKRRSIASLFLTDEPIIASSQSSPSPAAKHRQQLAADYQALRTKIAAVHLNESDEIMQQQLLEMEESLIGHQRGEEGEGEPPDAKRLKRTTD